MKKIPKIQTKGIPTNAAIPAQAAAHQVLAASSRTVFGSFRQCLSKNTGDKGNTTGGKKGIQPVWIFQVL